MKLPVEPQRIMLTPDLLNVPTQPNSMTNPLFLWQRRLSSPAESHELPQLELSWSRVITRSSRAH